MRISSLVKKRVQLVDEFFYHLDWKLVLHCVMCSVEAPRSVWLLNDEDQLGEGRSIGTVARLPAWNPVADRCGGCRPGREAEWCGEDITELIE